MSGITRRARFGSDHRWAQGHISAYLDGDLAARARARLDRHAQECPECRGILHSMRRMLALLPGLGPGRGRANTPDIATVVRRRLQEPPTG
jgi:anti-sigma factor RsiW